MLELVVKLHLFVTGRMTSFASNFQSRTATRRAAGFLEYSLLALGALAAFIVFSKLFIPELNNVFTNITDTLKGNRTNK